MSTRTFGLTGGIASGKSTTIGFFSQLGVATCDTDQLAREAIAPGSDGLAELTDVIGSKYFNRGVLDRNKLRIAIFHKPDLKKKVEAVIHPRVYIAINNWRNQTHNLPYRVLASPLLLESDHGALDGVIVVDVDLQLQIQRAIARDGQNFDAIKPIIKAQMSREDRLRRATYILDNSGCLDSLNRQIEFLHGKLIYE